MMENRKNCTMEVGKLPVGHLFKDVNGKAWRFSHWYKDQRFAIVAEDIDGNDGHFCASALVQPAQWLAAEWKSPRNAEQMPAFRVHLSDGTSYVTSMARGVTLRAAREYFIGAEFEIEEGKPNVRAVKVEQVKGGAR